MRQLKKTISFLLLGILLSTLDLSLLPILISQPPVLLVPPILAIDNLSAKEELFWLYFGSGLIFDIFSSNFFGLWIIIFLILYLISLLMKKLFIQEELNLFANIFVIYFSLVLVLNFSQNNDWSIWWWLAGFVVESLITLSILLMTNLFQKKEKLILERY